MRTDRLELVPMSVAFVRAVLALDRRGAGRALGIKLTDHWPVGNEGWLERTLARLEADPGSAPWHSRAVVLRDRTLIGRAGFHGPPNGAGEAEFGFEIDEPYRRNGYASEAARALLEWGFARDDLRTVVALAAPDNEVSMHMLANLGFARSDPGSAAPSTDIRFALVSRR